MPSRRARLTESPAVKGGDPESDSAEARPPLSSGSRPGGHPECGCSSMRDDDGGGSGKSERPHRLLDAGPDILGTLRQRR